MTPAPSPPSCIAPKPSIIRTSLLREVSHSQEQEQQQHISLTGATVVSSPGSMSRHSCEKCHLATSQIQADKKMVGTYFANGRSALSEACNRRNTPIQIANDDRTKLLYTSPIRQHRDINFRRQLVLGCIKTNVSEKRVIFQHFSNCTSWGHISGS